MVDITAKLFWYRTKEWYENMADKLNDIVYTDDSKETVNVINLLLLGWILLGLIVYIIGTIIATQLRKRKTAYEASKSEPKDEKPDTTEHVSCAPEVKSTVENEVFSEPEVIQKPFIIPSCTGENPEGVEWINSVFKWIYVHRVVSPIIESWLSALNARTRLASTEHGILVDFKDVKSIDPPTITNVMQAGSSVEDMTVFCQTDIEDVIFDIIVTQFKEKDKIIIPFTLNVKRLSGKMNVECCPEDLTFIARYSEAPQVQLSTETVNNSIAAQEDYQALCDLVCEITTEALLSSIINLRFTCYPECPRLSIKLSASDKVCEAEENESGEQLLVKIIKATNIGGDKGCLKPYCVVEMDEPPQKYETRDVEEKSNPFWDESFIFTVKDVSAELLFEVYDKGKSSNENFLGLGIVSVEELIKNPSQRQIIPLQSRPMEKDDVTGSLTTEFLFLNQITPVSEPTYLAQHNGIGDGVHGPGKTVETNSRVTAGGTVITTTTIKRTNQETCGRPEATSNEIANSISNNSAGPILTSVHEVAEEQNHKMNFAINEQAVVSDANKMNGDPKMHKSIIENNHLNENLNEVESALKNVSTCINDKIEGLTLNTVCETKENNEFGKMSLNSEKQCSFLNGVPDLECNTVHVHAPPNTPVILVGDFLPKTDENCSLPIKIEENGIIGATELHDISETVENSMSFSRDTDSSSIELCSTLPPIAEQVEISSSSSKGLENYNDNEADLTGTALKELEKHKPNASKSTLIIHSVQRENTQPNVKVAMDKCGQWQEVQEPDSSVSESLEASPASRVSKDSCTSYSESVPSSPSQGQSGDDRSRSKEKKTFIGSLKRKLSFRKPRSKSAENRSESAESNYSHGSSRSASTDRFKHVPGQKLSPFKGKFMGQKHLAVPGSTRSSLSEASGISASSSRTYINENSTLVVETNENGIIKRYLIPNSLINRSKWKKRGVKLHIFNDHVFVAKHLSGSTTCKVCQKYLTRRPGKQGYECRGCNLQCHKSCHVKVTTYCSNSSINSMEVEYIHDPRGATPKSI